MQDRQQKINHTAETLRRHVFGSRNESYEALTDDLTDLLTDLRHWAATEKIDFDRAVAISQDHFKAES